MKILTLILWAGLNTATFAQTDTGQIAAANKTATSDVTSERGQDGLKGAVRRVSVETAKIVFKNDKLTEESRVVRAITTYDARGRRIDSIAHPVEANRPPGKEQYRYDDKGNIVEMVLRGEDGLMLARESYEYEFDALGNWKKKTASIGIYENGKVGFEPFEVTYRTIAYYYTQAVEKIAKASGAPVRNSTPTPSDRVDLLRTADAQNRPRPSAEPAGAAELKPQEQPASVLALKPVGITAENKNSVKTETPAGTLETPAPKKIAVKYVSEALLRAAAVELPEPEFPRLAQLSGKQRRVEVQVLINEKGEVTSARGTSAESVLNEPAEVAARKSRFSAARLSEEPAQVFSVISYELSPGESTPAPITPLVSEKKEEVSPKRDMLDATPASASGPPNAPAAEDTASHYKMGLAFMSAGQYEEAVSALKQFVYHNPEDALGYIRLGVAYSALKRYEDAVAVFKLAIKVRPDVVDASTYYQLALAYDSLKKYSDSLNAFRQALYVRRAQMVDTGMSIERSGPTLAMLQHSIGLEYYKMGRYNDAIKEMKEAVKLNPQIAESYYAMAMAYMSLGDRRSAEKQESILRTLNPALATKVAAELTNRTLFIPPGCLALPCP